MKRPGILWLMIFSVCIPIHSQDFEETILFADLQFANSNYQSAVKEYQRALYFSNGIKNGYLYRQIAHSFFNNRQFEQADYFYGLSYQSEKNDSIKKEIIFNKSQCCLLSGDFKKSIYELTSLGDSLSEYFQKKRYFYYAVSYFGTEEFNKSKEYFIQLVNDNQKAKKEIGELFDRKRNLLRPNPKTAKTLSMIIPGSGQIYAGDVKNGLNSIALTGSFVSLGFYMFQEYSFLDAFLTSFSWFMRYYQGGYEKAKNIATQKRAIRRNKTYHRVLKIIEDNELKDGN